MENTLLILFFFTVHQFLLLFVVSETCPTSLQHESIITSLLFKKKYISTGSRRTISIFPYTQPKSSRKFKQKQLQKAMQSK